MLHLPSCLRAFYSFSSATVSERRCSSPLGAASNTVRTGRGNGEMIGVSGLAIRLCLEPRRVGTTSLEMLQRSSSSPPSDSIDPFSPLSFSLFLPSSRFNVIRFEVMFGNTIFVKKNETFLRSFSLSSLRIRCCARLRTDNRGEGRGKTKLRKTITRGARRKRSYPGSRVEGPTRENVAER